MLVWARHGCTCLFLLVTITQGGHDMGLLFCCPWLVCALSSSLTSPLSGVSVVSSCEAHGQAAHRKSSKHTQHSL